MLANGTLALADCIDGNYESASINTAAMFLGGGIVKGGEKGAAEVAGKYGTDIAEGTRLLKTEGTALADTAASVEAAGSGIPSQLIRGQEFEKTVLSERGLVKNGQVEPQIKCGNSIPDSVDGNRITEIKDVKYVYQSSQFRDYIESGMPVDLIVSPQSKISKPLKSDLAPV